MTRTFKHSAFLASLLVLGTAGLADAGIVVDTQAQSGFSGFFVAPAPITAAPFDFTGQTTLTSIDRISITLTIEDGDTNPGEFDFDDLFLLLDGINTGLALNGFGNDVTATLTLEALTPSMEAALLAAYNSDMMLTASIFDDDFGDNFITLPASFNATLELEGQVAAVPEPSTLAAGVLGVVIAGAAGRRRLSRKDA